MRFNKLLALLLALLMFASQLPVLAAEEAATFTVSSITPIDGARNVSIVSPKVDVTFSEPVDPATLTMANISVTSGAYRSARATSATTAIIYLDRAVLKLGEKYTVTLKSGIKSLTGASLVEKKITFSISREVPAYRQITNQGLDDPYFLSGFIGDTRNNVSVVNDGGNNVLKFVLPAWNEGALKMNPVVSGGTTYKGRLRFKLETASKAWLAALIYQPGNQNFYRSGTERIEYAANTWYTLEATWTIPDDAELEKFQFLFAVNDPNVIAYVDDIHFFEVGNDFDPPVIEGGAAGSSYAVIAERNTAVNKFKAFGVIGNGVEYDGTISRIDLVNSLLKIKGLESLPVVTSTKFTDVNESDMAAVQSVVDIGLMNGTSETTFEPSAKVTMDQVIKTILCLMGWGKVAEQEGGYPGGYNKVAANLGLLNNVDPAAGTTFTYEDYAMVLNNALNADVLGVVKYNGTIDAQVLVPDGKFIDTFFGYGYGTGIISGNENTYLHKEGSLAKDRILINDTVYICDADVQDYLGYKVVFYFEEKETEEHPVIKYITGISNNVVYEFDTETNYIDFEDDVYTIVPDGERREDEYELLNDKSVIYNGKYLGSYSNNDEKLVPKDGKIKLIDSGDGFDTVVITDIRTVFVSAVDYTNQVIYDDKSDLEPISLEKCEDVLIEDYDGGTWAFKDIKQWNVISVIQSLDGELTKIYLSTKTTAGPVVSITTEGGESELVIGDDFYGTNVRTSYDVVDHYFDVSTLSLTAKGTFYLDWREKVVAFSIGSAASGVGYLIEAVPDTSKMESSVEFKIFSVTGDMLYLKSGEKITIDNERVKDPYRALEILSKGTSEVVPQLIMFETNREGIVTYIDTAYNKLPETSDYSDVTLDKKEDADGFRVTYSSLMKPTVSKTLQDYYNEYEEDHSKPNPDAEGFFDETFAKTNGVRFNPSTRSFANKVQMTTASDPIMILVPWKDIKDKDDNYFIISKSAWDLGESDAHIIEAYQMNAKSMVADYVVIHIDGLQTAHVRSVAPQGIVQSKKSILRDDKQVIEITFTDGSKAYDDAGYTNFLAVGDICKVYLDQKRYIYRDVDMIYDASEASMLVGNPTDGYNGYSRIFMADVYEKNGTMVKVLNPTFNISDKKEVFANSEIMNLSGCNTYMYHRSKKEVMPASINDLIDYKKSGDDKSRIIIMSSKSKVNTVYIVTE